MVPPPCYLLVPRLRLRRFFCFFARNSSLLSPALPIVVRALPKHFAAVFQPLFGVESLHGLGGGRAAIHRAVARPPPQMPRIERVPGTVGLLDHDEEVFGGVKWSQFFGGVRGGGENAGRHRVGGEIEPGALREDLAYEEFGGGGHDGWWGTGGHFWRMAAPELFDSNLFF